MNRRLLVGFLTVQFVLLGFELLMRYDSWVRQLALALTNVLIATGLLIASRWLQRRGSALTPMTVWLAVAGVWFDALGNFTHFYGRFFWWDKLAHAAGSAALAGALAALIRKRVFPGSHRYWYILSLAVSLSVLYEITEYLGDIWFHTNRIPDRYDSPDDLLWNTLATVLVLAVLAWRDRRSSIDQPLKNAVD